MELTYDEVMHLLDTKYTSATSIGYTLPPGIYEISYITLMLKSLLRDDVKVNVTIDDFRLRLSLTTNKTMRFFKKSFFYTIFGSIQSNSGVLGDFESFAQLIPGSYKSHKSVNITGIDNIHLHCDCNIGNNVKGVR